MGLKTEFLVKAVADLAQKIGWGGYSEIGRKSGLNPVSVGKIAKNEVKPELESWEKLYDAFPTEIPPPQYEHKGRTINLRDDREVIDNTPPPDFTKVELIRIPLYDLSAGEPRLLKGGKIMGTPISFIPVPAGSVSDKAFGIINHGKQLEPVIPNDAMVIVDPAEELKNNSLTFVMLSSSDKAIWRLRQQSQSSTILESMDEQNEIKVVDKTKKGIGIFMITGFLKMIQ